MKLPACLLALLLAPAYAASPTPLQPLIDATPPGGTLRLAPGSYAGPAMIAKSMSMEGGRQAVIIGDGKSTVLSVAATGVTLRGLRLTGSGESHDRIDAGLLLEGDEHLVEDNEIDDVLFGIHLKQVNRSRVIANRIVGKKLTVAMRGDAIRMWYSRHNLVADNVFSRARDLTIANSTDNQIIGNRFSDGHGDQAHEIYLFADRIWMETPMATFFRNSPVLELLDFLERLAPFSAPHRVLQDPLPRMR